MSRRTLHGVANGWRSTLYSAMTAGAGTCVINAPTMAYPATPFRYTVDSERLRCSSIAVDTPSAGVDTLTVTRAQNGTSAAAHLVGRTAIQYADAGEFQEVQTRLAAVLDLLAAMMGAPVGGSVSGVQRTSAGTDLKVVAQGTPGMTVAYKAGAGIVSGEPVSKLADSNSATVVAPVTNPRIDIVEIDQDGTVSIKAGSEGAVPSAPAVDTDQMKLAEIYCRVGMTSIKNTDDAANGYITDSRTFL